MGCSALGFSQTIKEAQGLTENENFELADAVFKNLVQNFLNIDKMVFLFFVL